MTTVVLLSVLSFSNPVLPCNPAQNTPAITDTTKSSALPSGWYYLNETENGPKRQLENTSDFYFIDPVPIVTAKNFRLLEIYESEYAGKKYAGLSIRLDDQGTESWSLATKRKTGKKLAFILDNQLIYVSTIYGQITDGISALNRGDHTRQELEKIKLILEKEKYQP